MIKSGSWPDGHPKSSAAETLIDFFSKTLFFYRAYNNNKFQVRLRDLNLCYRNKIDIDYRYLTSRSTC